MQTIMIELPQWLYYTMAINLIVSATCLAFKLVDAIERN